MRIYEGINKLKQILFEGEKRAVRLKIRQKQAHCWWNERAWAKPTKKIMINEWICKREEMCALYNAKDGHLWLPKWDIYCLLLIAQDYAAQQKTEIKHEYKALQSWTTTKNHWAERLIYFVYGWRKHTETHEIKTFHFSVREDELNRCDRCHHHHHHCRCCCHCNRQQNETQNYFSINFSCSAGHIDCFHIMRLKMQ